MRIAQDFEKTLSITGKGSLRNAKPYLDYETRFEDDAQILKGLPKPLRFVNDKINEFSRQRAKLFAKHIAPALKEIDAIPDPFGRWYWRTVLKTRYATKRRAWHREFETPEQRFSRLTEAIKHLRRLKEYLQSPAKAESWERRRERLALAKERRISDLYSFRKARRSGKRLHACCPFHQDDTPSFVVYEDNSYHCFSCGAHGDSVDFIQKTQGMAFGQAVDYLTGGQS